MSMGLRRKYLVFLEFLRVDGFQGHEEVLVLRGDDGEGRALAPSPRRPPHPVDVGLVVVGHPVVHHQGHLGTNRLIKARKTRCRPPKGQRCIPDVVLKNEGSVVQTCRNINVHVVNTDKCRDQGLLYHRTCKRNFLCSWPSLNSYLK